MTHIERQYTESGMAYEVLQLVDTHGKEDESPVVSLVMD
jgi:hypothetical protein